MSKIEWTEKTWNIITGCTKKSGGCQNCYAEKMHKRLGAMGQEKYNESFNCVKFHNKELDRTFGKKPSIIFVNSMSDTFHEKIQAQDIEFILCACYSQPQHTFQILTKRAERLIKHTYPQNIWLGVSVELEKYKNRIEYLKKTNAKVKFLSCEPLLSDLGELDLNGIDWVIVGGESGHNARPMHPDWVRNIQKQCQEQNVPFFFKQWGEWSLAQNFTIDKHIKSVVLLDDGEINYFLSIDNISERQKEISYYVNHLKGQIMTKVGKKQAGCLLDGKEYKEYPKEVINNGKT